MSRTARQLRDVLARVETWPENLQKEAVETLLTLEEQGTGIYRIGDEEWADMQAGIAEADRREFVSDEELAKADRRHRP